MQGVFLRNTVTQDKHLSECLAPAVAQMIVAIIMPQMFKLNDIIIVVSNIARMSKLELNFELSDTI